MVGIDKLPVAILMMFGVFLIFIVFVCFTMLYLRYYFNKYEPVFTISATGGFEKNHIASRFCKIIMSNTITDQCLTDVDNIGLWMLASNVIAEWPGDTILNIKEIHDHVSEILVTQLDEIKYEKLLGNLIKLELALNSNLMKSKIRTPPYIQTSTYAVWVTRVLSTINKS